MDGSDGLIRCRWAEGGKLEQKYHDEEWGVPQRDDKKLFRMLMLEGMQAGLSWSTILKKMETMDKAFDGFDPDKVSKYDEKKVLELMNNEGIIRNRLKIESAITNSKAFLKLRDENVSFSELLWSYVGNEPIVNSWTDMYHVPASTPISDKISKDLKKMGFKFVGTTIVYAFMQATGMVNDHVTSCAFYKR